MHKLQNQHLWWDIQILIPKKAFLSKYLLLLQLLPTKHYIKSILSIMEWLIELPIKDNVTLVKTRPNEGFIYSY